MAQTANVTSAALQELGEQECLRLISPGGVGRVAFGSATGPVVLPVNYRIVDGAIVFRTRPGGAMDKDLRTGIKGLDIRIAFQVDEIDKTAHQGWSVLIQGPAHHADEAETRPHFKSWAGGERDHYVRIVPLRITGRRIGSL
ncbi:pyridoxamine 5'-phosphate oxidase family protein [Herbidospora mongoliensis]|uniref:pyridoxamine 5'-phosphate oxidase family protein n=1 Tax=Herbidospora mongoliensis TaxID=688067 RepID=UPI000830778D|nr:pyridoxamine 5'-phosphate oxidase family protein [Herbidospora mongoliensis]